MMASCRFIRENKSIKTEFSKEASSIDNYIIMSLRRFYRVQKYNTILNWLF